MDAFHKLFEQILEETPYKLITDLIVKKLAEKGIEVSNKDYERLEAQIHKHDFGSFKIRRWQFWKRKSIVVDLSNDELDLILNSYKDLLNRDKLSEVIDESAEQIAPQFS